MRQKAADRLGQHRADSRPTTGDTRGHTSTVDSRQKTEDRSALSKHTAQTTQQQAHEGKVVGSGGGGKGGKGWEGGGEGGGGGRVYREALGDGLARHGLGYEDITMLCSWL
jgi:hypothetical protein